MSSIAASHRPTSAYRPPPHRSLPPLPPRWASHAHAFDRPPLAHFVLLSILLHMLAILMFGAPSGGSREGRAMWGSLDVVIRGPFVEPEPLLKLDRGQFLPMFTPPKPAPVPTPPPRKVETPAPPPAPVAAPAPPPAPAVPEPKPEPLAIPPVLDRLKAPDRKEMAPTFRVPQPRERAAPAPAPAPAAEAPLPPPPAPAPAPRIERTPLEAPPAPVERAPVETPSIPAITPAPAPPTPTPPVERPPVEVPSLPVPEATAPARVQPAAKPVEKPATPEVAPAPTPAPAAAPSALERAIERAQEQPQPQQRQGPAKPESNPLPAPVQQEALPGPRAPGERKDLGDFPGGRSDYDPTKPALDLDNVRNRAGQLAREGSGRRALLPFPMPPVEKPKSKLESAIEKARKPDCKDAYKDLGLAAVVPLIANEFGEGNCRW